VGKWQTNGSVPGGLSTAELLDDAGGGNYQTLINEALGPLCIRSVASFPLKAIV
jgi:hypothetical protein